MRFCLVLIYQSGTVFSICIRIFQLSLAHTPFDLSRFQVTNIVGMKYINGMQWTKGLKEGDEIVLMREPDNKYDSNAIKVCDQQEHQIGYIPKNTARQISKEIDSKRQVKTYVVENSNGYIKVLIAIDKNINAGN